jgi:hypothetical protein
MRTRRSPRNQDRLWKGLGRDLASASMAEPVTPQPIVKRCFTCWSYPPEGRSRGECLLSGTIVNGRSENRPCHAERPEAKGNENEKRTDAEAITRKLKEEHAALLAEHKRDMKERAKGKT